MKKKLLIIIFNIVFGFNVFVGYYDLTNKKHIINTEKPISVEVLDVNYAKYGDRCKVKFNNKVYREIEVPSGVIIGDINTQNFYFDKANDIVFSNNIGQKSFYVFSSLFFLSLLLWFLPNKIFK